MAKGGKQPGSGRPKGSTTRPKLSDHLKKKDIKAIIAKAKELAMAGDTKLIIFILEQMHGKAPQSLEVSGPDGAPMLIKLNE